MDTVILCCESLLLHLNAAQQKMNTHYEIFELDSKLHAEPEKMRDAVFQKMESLPDEVETVLIAMGLCGGSVSQLPLPKRIVMPKVDDCITMLLHTDEIRFANLKKAGHLYLTDTVDGKLSVENIQNNLFEKYGERKGRRIFDMWFKDYKSVDIIDTGIYDCHNIQYVESARKSAALISCPLTYVPGSNILLEKLVAGYWDDQFMVAEKGRILKNEDFL